MSEQARERQENSLKNVIIVVIVVIIVVVVVVVVARIIRRRSFNNNNIKKQKQTVNVRKSVNKKTKLAPGAGRGRRN